MAYPALRNASGSVAKDVFNRVTGAAPQQRLLRGRLPHTARLQHHLRQMAMRLCDAKPRRIKPGEQGCARGRTQRLPVGIAKFHPACGQPVNVRRLVKRRAVARKVAPAEIVGEDENNVRLF